MNDVREIALGGGCHWCTEAVFQAVEGVVKVEQGYVASEAPADAFTEAIIVHYDPRMVDLERLIEIHLYTHKSTSNHSFRTKYRSAVYFFDNEDGERAKQILESLQQNFEKEIVTKVLPFRDFKISRESIQDYYRQNPDAPFCRKYIEPKLEVLRDMST